MKTVVVAFMLTVSLTGVMASVYHTDNNNYVQIKKWLFVQPFGSCGTKTIFITPNNIRYYAKYLDSSITVDDRVIRVTSGTSYETLLTVPLTNADELDTDVIIRVTVGLDLDIVTTDNDIRVGISDGSYYNQFYITDTTSRLVCSICMEAAMKAIQLHAEGTSYYPGQVTMIFQPFYKYGSCYTGYDGGHVNVAKFTSTV